MKNIISILFICLFGVTVYAQSPSLLNYQGVARDNNNQPLVNQTISLKISILENSSNGTIIFTEKHLVTTTSLGVFSLQVGNGQNQFGNISNVDWASRSHWMQVEMDVTGGSNYLLMGSSQLVSVPYALHAETVTNKDDADADPTNEIQQIQFDVFSNILTLEDGGSIDLSSLDNDGNGTNSGTDDQVLSLNNTILSIEDGNSVDLSIVQDGFIDADADPTNEIQTLTKNGTSITLSNGGGTVKDEVNDADADPTNEIQTLIKNGTTITLSNGGGSIKDEVDDADNDPTNEFQTIKLNGNFLEITNGNEVDLSPIKDGVDDADADPSNEIQTLGFNASTNILSLSNGGNVDLSGLDNDGGGTGTGTDDQVLSINGTQLSIEDGNTVDLSLIQDGVTDADANPMNELQDLQLQNDILSLTNSNASIDLTSIKSPWKTVNQTAIIEYDKQDALAIIKSGDKALNIAPEQINFKDNTECRTYIENGNFIMNREIPIGNDVQLVIPAVTLNKDAIAFDDFDDDTAITNQSVFGRDSAYLYNKINNIEWTNKLESYQMDMRINDDEVWGNFDAFGFQGVTNNSTSVQGDWELQLKTGLGLYMDVDKGQNVNEASLTTPSGFYLGEGIGAGFLDQTFTQWSKDSLSFNSYINNGLLSGSSAYGRDELHLGFQAGGQFNQTTLTPSNFSFTNSINGNSNYMNLGHNYLEFENSNFGSRFTHIGLDSIYITGSIGLLLPETANLKPFELSFSNLTNQSYYSSTGFTVKESLSSVDIYDRIRLVPDELAMFNDTKWQTVHLGTNPNDKQGEMKLFGNGNDVHTYIGGNDTFGSVIEMNYGSDLRTGFWAFEDFGLLNTMGNNGFQNTFAGTAQSHNDPNMGGLGVMDNIGFIKAGMEVDEFGVGYVYSNGKYSILNNNQDEMSRMDLFGYSLFNDNGDYILGLGRDFLNGNAGFYTTFGENGSLNFLTGSNPVYNGNSNTGYAAVYDENGDEKAGMFVDQNGKGYQFADLMSIGELPSPLGTTYPLSIQQKENFGISLKNSGLTANWEQYVDHMDRFTLYFNNVGKGFFDPVTGNYITFSDRRLKKDIHQINSVLKDVSKLNPSSYSYTENNPTNQKSIGFIAQEVQKIFPELVKMSNEERSKGMLAVDYSGFTVLAIKAIQEQQIIIDEQGEEIEDLKSRLARIEKLLAEK